MESLRDQRMNEQSEKAFQAGKAFAKKHSFSEFKDDRDSSRLMNNCPFHLQRFADVFKYGCQDVWRKNGELREVTDEMRRSDGDDPS